MAQLLSRLRRAPERLFHARRRRRARAALAARPRPRVVFVVCNGNICSSPFAAALLARALPGAHIESAGFVGPGRPVPREALTAAARYGVDLFGHRSQVLTAERVRAAGLIVVMSPAHRREICDWFGRAARNVVILGDLDPEPGESRTIRDPVGQPLAVFEATYARIARCTRELTRAIAVATGSDV